MSEHERCPFRFTFPRIAQDGFDQFCITIRCALFSEEYNMCSFKALAVSPIVPLKKRNLEYNNINNDNIYIKGGEGRSNKGSTVL